MYQKNSFDIMNIIINNYLNKILYKDVILWISKSES